MTGQSQPGGQYLRDGRAGLWRDNADCQYHQDLPWSPDITPNDVAAGAMRRVCANCPVIRECASYALTFNDRGVEGGFYAGVWIPWRGVGGGNPKAVDDRITRKRARRLLAMIIGLDKKDDSE